MKDNSGNSILDFEVECILQDLPNIMQNIYDSYKMDIESGLRMFDNALNNFKVYDTNNPEYIKYKQAVYDLYGFLIKYKKANKEKFICEFKQKYDQLLENINAVCDEFLDNYFLGSASESDYNERFYLNKLLATVSTLLPIFLYNLDRNRFEKEYNTTINNLPNHE